MSHETRAIQLWKSAFPNGIPVDAYSEATGLVEVARRLEGKPSVALAPPVARTEPTPTLTAASRDGRLSVAEAARIANVSRQALYYAHKKGWIAIEHVNGRPYISVADA